MNAATIRKIVRFFIAGTASTLVNLAILFLCVEYFHLHYLLAALCAYLGSLAFGFSLQKFWSFQDPSLRHVHFQLVEYIAVTLFNMGLNTLLMYVFVSVFNVWYLFAQIIAATILAFSSYFAYNRFVFRPRAPKTTRPASAQSQ